MKLDVNEKQDNVKKACHCWNNTKDEAIKHNDW